MNKQAILVFIGLVAVALAAGPVAAKTPAAVKGAIDGRAPKAVFPELKYEFEPVTEGVKITHDFIIENQGDAPLVIKNIRPD